MNRYDVEHVLKMLIPLTDKIDELEHKMNNADIYAVQELIKNDPGISELSKRIEEVEHDMANLKMGVTNTAELMKIVMDKLKSLETTNSEILKRIKGIKFQSNNPNNDPHLNKEK